jgi:hypothetical protein
MRGCREGGDTIAGRLEGRLADLDTRSRNGLARVAVHDVHREVRRWRRRLRLLGGFDGSGRRRDGRLVTAGAGTKAGGDRTKKDE